MTLHCPRCNTECAAEANFCAQCGARLRNASPEPHGENRQVTVFFVDLVDSTPMFRRWGQEETSEIQEEFRVACAKVILRYQGSIEREPGDAVVAFFGYPVAHEDDAMRAVRSGLEIVEVFSRTRFHGHRLQPRISISTGPVTARGQSLFGETVVVAERLQKEAKANTILMSESTRRLVEGHFTLTDLGPHSLKGIADPVIVYEVLGNADPPSRFDAVAASGLTPFTGRMRESQVIRSLWSRAVAGEGQTLLLQGEAGIGKSRLLGIVRDLAKEGGQDVFTAQCSPYHRDSEFHPVVEMLARNLNFAPERSTTRNLALLEEFVASAGVESGEALPLLAGLLSLPAPPGDPQSGLSPPLRRQRTREILADLLLHPRNRAPTVILIEDLHWADSSTLELVDTLAERRTATPLFLGCTIRTGPGAPQRAFPDFTVMDVEAMPPEEARALVTSVADRKPLPEAVLQEILDRTDAVPLFTEAVTRSIIDSGVLHDAGDHYVATGPLPDRLIPETLEGALMARIDLLGKTRKPVAQLAATIGEEFGFDLLCGVLQRLDTGITPGPARTEEALRSTLEEMVDLGLISRTGSPSESTFAFRHALLQEVAYRSLLRKTCQKYHGTIAEFLLEHTPTVVESAPELLARHFEGAGRFEEAIDHWTAAGLTAQLRSAERECVAYLRRAISLLEAKPDDDPDRIAKEMVAQLALGPALMATRGWASREVEAACARARDLCVRANNPQGLVRALWGLWTVLFVRGKLEGALEAAEAVLGMADPETTPILRLAGHHAVGFTRYFRGEFPSAREHGAEGFKLYDPDRERALMELLQIPSSVCCLVALTQSLRFMGYPEQARTQYDRMCEVIDLLEYPVCLATALNVAMYYDYDVRDLETVLRKADRAYEISVEGGFELWIAAMQVYRGWARSLSGDTQTGLPEIRQGLDGFSRMGAGLAMSAMMTMLAEALRADGQNSAALGALATAMRIVDDRNERYFEVEIHRLDGEIRIEQGAAAEGEASLRKAIEVARRQNARLLELRSANALSRLLRSQNRSKEATQLLRPLYDWFTEGFDERELKEARLLLEEMEMSAVGRPSDA